MEIQRSVLKMRLAKSQWAKDNGRGTADELHVVVYDTTGDITGYDADVCWTENF